MQYWKFFKVFLELYQQFLSCFCCKFSRKVVVLLFLVFKYASIYSTSTFPSTREQGFKVLFCATRWVAYAWFKWTGSPDKKLFEGPIKLNQSLHSVNAKMIFKFLSCLVFCLLLNWKHLILKIVPKAISKFLLPPFLFSHGFSPV